MKTITTHNGSFHSDDVFACAVLAIYFEHKKEFFNIIRTRDENIISTSDVVVDVGGIYDEKNNRFDHHQKGGAGIRENGVPYASFGLVWKKFGYEMLETEIADMVDSILVGPIDAVDNAYNLSIPIYENLRPYYFSNIIDALRPTWREQDLISEVSDEYFAQAVDLAKITISREIRRAKDFIHAKIEIMKIYNETKDKRLIVIDKNYPWKNVLIDLPEPLYVIYPGTLGYKIEGVQTSLGSFERRKYLPEKWAGSRDNELAEITGVADAIFCHNGRFIAGAKTLDGIMEMGRQALGD